MGEGALGEAVLHPARLRVVHALHVVHREDVLAIERRLGRHVQQQELAAEGAREPHGLDFRRVRVLGEIGRVQDRHVVHGRAAVHRECQARRSGAAM